MIHQLDDGCLMITTAIGASILGILTWSLLEYLIHRWVAHARGFWHATPFGQEHTRHHAEGDYFAPTSRKALAAIFIMALISPLAIVLTNVVPGAVFTASLVITYVAYEFLHRRLHTHMGNTAYGRWARHHHFHHHFVDPRTNHGVTSPLWDIVFGTYRKPKIIRVPARLRMSWLVDPHTGEVIEKYADTFVVGKTAERDDVDTSSSIAYPDLHVAP